MASSSTGFEPVGDPQLGSTLDERCLEVQGQIRMGANEHSDTGWKPMLHESAAA